MERDIVEKQLPNYDDKILRFGICGTRQIFNNVEYSEAIVGFQFVEKEITKCQPPTYIGKSKLKYCVMITSSYDVYKSYEILYKSYEIVVFTRFLK